MGIGSWYDDAAPDDDAEVDLEEMERQRAAYDRATPAERRAVIGGSGSYGDFDEDAGLDGFGGNDPTDPEVRANAALEHADAIRDQQREGK